MATAHTLVEVLSRFPPLQCTLINFALPEKAETCRRRRHSFCGAPSWYLQEVYRQSAESDVSDPILRRRSTAPTTPTHVGTADADSEARNNEMVAYSPGWSINEMFEDSPGGSRQMSRFGASGASKCEDIDSDSNGAEEITTMIIRNMPFRWKQRDVVSELDHSGFGGTYDWLYMPSNFTPSLKSRCHGKGYAFVNFIKPEFATRFKEEWHCARPWRASITRVLDISVATVQGKEKSIEQFMRGKTSRILSSSFRPFEPESILNPVSTVEDTVQSASEFIPLVVLL